MPMKIFYGYSTFSHMVPLPVRVFTARVTTYSRRIKFKTDLKLVRSNGNRLRQDQFEVRQLDSNTFEVFLLEQCLIDEKIQLELNIELYNENQFSSCLLNKIFVFVTI